MGHGGFYFPHFEVEITLLTASTGQPTLSAASALTSFPLEHSFIASTKRLEASTKGGGGE